MFDTQTRRLTKHIISFTVNIVYTNIENGLIIQ